MTLKERCLAWEKKKCLCDREIDGFQYWSYCRLQYLSMIYENKENVPDGKNTDFFKKIFHLIYSIKGIIAAHKVRCDYLIINHPRLKWNSEENTYECLYTEQLCRDLGNKAYTLEYSNRAGHLIPHNLDNLIYADFLDVFPHLAERIWYRYLKKETQKKFVQAALEISKMIQNEFSIEIPAEEMGKTFFFQYCCWLGRKKIIRHMLKSMHPKIIVEVVSIHIYNMTLNEVAKEFLIPTMEIQHGLLDVASQASIEGKSIAPDYLAMFGKIWELNKELFVPKKHRFYVGYPYLEESLKKYKDQMKRRKELSILLLPQPANLNYFISLASDLCIKMKKVQCNGFKIVLKLHPDNFLNHNDKLESLNALNEVIVVRNSEKNLHEYMAECTVQIGIFSTALYEGIAFGLETYLPDCFEDAILVEDLVNLGYARKYSSIEQLIDWIMFKTEKEKKDISDVWAPNARQNLKDAVMQVVTPK